MSKKPTIALIGGEGIGPEVVEATAKVISHLLPQAKLVRPPHGPDAVKKFGKQVPEESAQMCRDADAVLFGTASDHTWEVMVFMRWGLQNFASVRPTITRPGTLSPINTKGPVDLVIVRECLEGEYPAREGELSAFKTRWPDFKDAIGQEIPTSGKFAMRVITEAGVLRITEVASKLAQARAIKRKRPSKVTIVTKANILTKSDGMFLEIAKQRLKKDNIEFDQLFVDEACRRLVISPEKLDIILSPNLFGDIMSSITSELGGGIGVAPSAVTGGVTPYYESVHGSAPDIAGQGIANPLATILSAQMMLEDLNCIDEAMAIERAVAKLLAEKKILTKDLGGRSSTADVTAALISIL